MKLSCPSCGAKYSIADEKVQDRLAKIRCRKCSATIIVDGKVNPPNVYTSDAGTAATSDVAEHGGAVGAGEYSVDFGDNDQRTMTADDIVAAFRRGEVTYDTYVWADGMTDWSPISAVPELSQALSNAAAAPVAAPVPAPVAEVPRHAARSGAGRGSAHDLFGGIERAGGEDEVMTSAAAAAPAPAAAAPVAATGARNESSVLFSLSALTASSGPAAAPTATAASGSSDKSDHDSGLIDLKALASSAATAQAPASPLMLGTAPLGMAAPLGGITAPAVASESPMMMPKGQSKTGLIVGAILFGFVLIAGAVFMALNKEAPPAPAAPAPVATAPVAPTPEPKKEEPTATPPATGTASAEPPKTADTKQASAPAAPKSATSTPRKKAASGGGAAAAPAPAPEPAAPAAEAAPAAAPKPKPKKESSCNCPPGDLMCAMKCASGGH